ncbi:hypothetical protein BCY86_07355 [Pajaroellobacter abortibovis]|uniref:DUF3293 domain-containing protein n=2 Tax=Pajaroellobacter abortibovis TaxID=1882918 RepID=A0A1L6MYC6_9BACT|nr:hypothetical protein BCY86_07355 [Pajaroellobacter abortibovis]
MDQSLLRQYLATVYEFPSPQGVIRASMDGDMVMDPSSLPELLIRPFCVLTAYNPRSMLLPRRINEARHLVLRDLLILGCYRVEACVGSEEGTEGVWREPSWLIHGIERDEAIAFGRVFRQNCIIVCHEGRPELVVTDTTFDDVGKTITGNWRMRV